MKRIIIVFLALVLVVPLFAQENESDRINKGLEKGYQFNIDGGGLLCIGSDYSAGLKMVIVNSYQFNPHFSIGIGTGFWYDWYKSYCASVAGEGPVGPLLPFFADFRVNILNKKLSPYFSMGLGVLYHYPGQTYNGDQYYFGIEQALINPTVGLSYKVSKWMVLNAGFGLNIAPTYTSGGEGGCW